jgi:hypothetical protein
MTTIAENTGVVTLINVFTVEPSNQQKLVDILARATDTSVRDVPGFISAALHRSVDGTRVTMYASGRARSTTSTTNRCVQTQSLHHTWNRHSP